MKRFLRISGLLTIVTAIALMTAGCNNRSSAITQMVDELNSAEFRAAEAQTGLFADSEAKVEGSSLTITFICRPFIDLSTFSNDRIPELRASAVKEFKANLSNPAFRSGIEALHHNDMIITLVWEDVYQHKITLTLSPAEILDLKE